MSIKETNLTTITEVDFNPNDFVRVLEGSSSRKITLEDFTDAVAPILVGLGFTTGSLNDAVAVSTKSTNYNLTVDDRVILMDTSSGALGVNLPAAAEAYDTPTATSIRFTIKKITADVNAVSIYPQGIEQIDGNVSFNLVGGGIGATLPEITLISDGFDWYILSA